MSYTRFTNCDLCDNGKIYKNKDLFIDTNTGKIVSEPNSGNVKIVDLQGGILAPGFIDIQNNGIYGLNFSNLNSTSTEQDIKEFKEFYRDAMRKYLTTGVTAMCPTVTSSFPEVYEKVLPLYKSSRLNDATDSLGAHVEGPFISKNKKGCHPVETIIDAKEGTEKVFDVYGGDENLTENVCILTAAPELPGVLETIPIVKDKNIVFSIGHTMTDYKTGLKAVQNGATMITHLYNAMPQPHHRDVGVLGLITSPVPDMTPYFGLICDGVHADPSMVVVAYRSAPEKCILVTDAMHLIGLPDGLYKWDSQYIEKNGSRLYLKGTKTLAGAATTLPQCVRNLMLWGHIPLAEAVKTVTNTPAKSIGLEKERGFLNEGCNADLVVLDEQCYVKKVYKLGTEVVSTDETQPLALIASL